MNVESFEFRIINFELKQQKIPVLIHGNNIFNLQFPTCNLQLDTKSVVLLCVSVRNLVSRE